MIINLSLSRILITFLLGILLPLIQNQWLNLYLFDINNSYFYKYLYFLSGLICPLLVSINSINIFTFYSFNNSNKPLEISGKFLFLVAAIVLVTLSTLLSYYYYLNLEIICKLFLNKNYLFNIDYNNKTLFIFILSIALIFKKTRILIKKSTLLNFFMISIFIWYVKVNNISIEISLSNIFELENINFINIIYFSTIEIIYYLWSYISYKSNLSDWQVPRPNRKDFVPIVIIVIFYLWILFYYYFLK